MATYSLELSIEIATKPMQMKTWLLMTAYKKSQAPYSMVSDCTIADPLRLII